MERTIYSLLQVDHQTGEVMKSKTITRRVQNVEHFVKAYVADMTAIINCSNSEKNLILCIIREGFIEYETNEIVLNMPRKLKVSECAGITLRSMHNSLYRLIAKNIIVRYEKKLILNPCLFFSGSEMERDKLFELKIQYLIGDVKLKKNKKKSCCP